MSVDKAGTDDVQALYEKYPYPSANAEAEPIYDVAMSMDLVVAELAGQDVLDAGCGTGHRLVALATAYPDTSFVGVDISARSLAVARDLARNQGCGNIEFYRAEIGGVELGHRFDLVISTGVIHHLEEPAAGVAWLDRHSKETGLTYTWHYHPYGEFDRLRNRDLVRLLSKDVDRTGAERVLADLGMSISVQQYGTRTSHADDSPESQLIADADAYLHPIVNAYRFHQAAGLFAGTSDWAVINGVNWDGGAAVIDMADWTGTTFSTLGLADLFGTPWLQELFNALTPREQLDCLELRLRPTGFTLVTGSAASLSACTPRLQRNVALADLLHTM